MLLLLTTTIDLNNWQLLCQLYWKASGLFWCFSEQALLPLLSQLSTSITLYVCAVSKFAFVFMSCCYVRVAGKGPLKMYSKMAATTTSTGCALRTTACAWLISSWLCKSALTSYFLKANSLSATSFNTKRELGLHLLLFCCLSLGRHWDAALQWVDLFTTICLWGNFFGQRC